MSAQDDIAQPPEAGSPAPRRRSRFGIWMLLSLALIVAVTGIAVLSLTGRSLPVPRWASEQIEARLNASIVPAELSIGGAELMFARDALPRVRFTGVRLSDGQGRPVVAVPELRVRFEARPLLEGKLVVRRVAMVGAEVTVRRDAGGDFDLALGEAVAPVSADASPAEVLAQIDAAFASRALAPVDTLTVEDLRLSYEDGRAGRSWQVSGGLLTIDQDPREISARLFFSLTSDLGQPSEVAMGFELEKGTREARMSANFSDMPSVDIATQSPALAFLTVVDAPISGAVRSGIRGDGTLAPLSAALEIGAGALSPDPGAAPIRFDQGKAYFSYDPGRGRITFDQIAVGTEALSLEAEGHAYLRDEVAGWPSALVTQMRLRRVALTPKGVFEDPAVFTAGAVDLKIGLDPFEVVIGQAVLSDAAGVDYRGSGRVRADAEGWQVAVDATLDQISESRLLAMWPVDVVPNTRAWVQDNVQGGVIFDVKAALRLASDRAPVAALSYEFRDATVRFMRAMPPIEGGYGYSAINGNSFTMVLDRGSVSAPDGGQIEAGGSVMRVPDISRPNPPAEITLKTDSTVQAVLSLLDLPPLQIMSRAGQPTGLAQGRAKLTAQIGLELKRDVTTDEVAYTVTGQLLDIRSEALVKDRVLAAEVLDIAADPETLTISGRATLDGVGVQGVWSQPLGQGEGGVSRFEGQVELSALAVERFNIGLPEGAVTGKGLGDIALELSRASPVAFELSSDLNRVGLRLDGIGWRKPANATGRLEVAGILGAPPVISRLELEASGLTATGGRVTVTPEGGLQTARFARVRLGGWLDAPVTLKGRGVGAEPAVEIAGGTVDLRRMPDRMGGNGGGPVELALDRLVVSDGITLVGLRGSLTPVGGLNGSLTGTVAGGAPVRITLAPSGAGTGLRVRSDNAGGVLRGAGVFEKSNGGQMDLILTPRGAPGDYDGQLGIKNLRVTGAGALAELLNAISVVGLIEMMDGQGLSFGDVQAEFRLTRQALEIKSGSAIGPSMGISMAGLYTFENNRIHMQGVVSPLYMFNAIGALISRRGEGLFGFNYSLTGDAKDPKVRVNPLSILTPGMFREIFRRPPPELSN